MSRPIKQIISIKGLQSITGLSRARLYQYIEAKRIRPEYQDVQSRMYWTTKTAQAIKQALHDQRTRGQGKKGKRLNLEAVDGQKTTDKRSGRGQEDNQGERD